MPRARHSDLGDVFTFGGRVPPAVGALITAIVLASLVGALGQRYDFVRAAALVPELVWQGQVWRLFTWVFFETDPLSLLFGGVTLYFFGRDLCWAWGPRRFIATFFGIAVTAAGVTCLAALGWPALRLGGWTGSWPVLLALTVAWAMLFPERQILLMFALPVSGRALLWITVGGTVLYAVFGRVYAYVPHFAAQLLMMAYARGWSLRGFWQQLRIRGYERRARRRASHLKVVKKDPPRWMN
ncbi:MAG TPA: rhomboid family intramembrane serine protease [Anaeromyxobacteraceae bacterium]|nr:rhomboid family intramembrane serine protease [Anaeromyxobacteraceae bacterium]